MMTTGYWKIQKLNQLLVEEEFRYQWAKVKYINITLKEIVT